MHPESRPFVAEAIELTADLDNRDRLWAFLTFCDLLLDDRDREQGREFLADAERTADEIRSSGSTLDPAIEDWINRVRSALEHATTAIDRTVTTEDSAPGPHPDEVSKALGSELASATGGVDVGNLDPAFRLFELWDDSARMAVDDADLANLAGTLAEHDHFEVARDLILVFRSRSRLRGPESGRLRDDGPALDAAVRAAKSAAARDNFGPARQLRRLLIRDGSPTVRDYQLSDLAVTLAANGQYPLADSLIRAGSPGVPAEETRVEIALAALLSLHRCPGLYPHPQQIEAVASEALGEAMDALWSRNSPDETHWRVILCIAEHAVLEETALSVRDRLAETYRKWRVPPPVDVLCGLAGTFVRRGMRWILEPIMSHAQSTADEERILEAMAEGYADGGDFERAQSIIQNDLTDPERRCFACVAVGAALFRSSDPHVVYRSDDERAKRKLILSLEFFIGADMPFDLAEAYFRELGKACAEGGSRGAEEAARLLHLTVIPEQFRLRFAQETVFRLKQRKLFPPAAVVARAMPPKHAAASLIDIALAQDRLLMHRQRTRLCTVLNTHLADRMKSGRS